MQKSSREAQRGYIAHFRWQHYESSGIKHMEIGPAQTEILSSIPSFYRRVIRILQKVEKRYKHIDIIPCLGRRILKPVEDATETERQKGIHDLLVADFSGKEYIVTPNRKEHVSELCDGSKNGFMRRLRLCPLLIQVFQMVAGRKQLVSTCTNQDQVCTCQPTPISMIDTSVPHRLGVGVHTSHSHDDHAVHYNSPPNPAPSSAPSSATSSAPSSATSSAPSSAPSPMLVSFSHSSTNSAQKRKARHIETGGGTNLARVEEMPSPNVTEEADLAKRKSKKTKRSPITEPGRSGNSDQKGSEPWQDLNRYIAQTKKTVEHHWRSIVETQDRKIATLTSKLKAAEEKLVAKTVLHQQQKDNNKRLWCRMDQLESQLKKFTHQQLRG